MKYWKIAWRFLPLSLLVLLLTGCFGVENITALDPKGPQSQWIYDNMILSLYVMAFVTIVVFTIFFIILAKNRHKPGDDVLPEQVEGNTTLEIIWTVIPIILLMILAVPTITGTFILADDSPDPIAGEDTVNIKVTGHQFWWQFDYEDEGFTAGQEVYIPAGEKVLFELHAQDVMHAFWVPSLGGKVDTIPGVTNFVWLEADEPGVYYGKCAELCGPAHSLMEFKVIAVERSEYDAWIASMQAEVEEPTDALVQQGRGVFEDNSCIGCHAVGGYGTAAGPALTNFGDRLTVAGYLDMTDENIEKWIRDTEAVKQRNNMPSFPDMSDEDMTALIAYLRSLTVLE